MQHFFARKNPSYILVWEKEKKEIGWYYGKSLAHATDCLTKALYEESSNLAFFTSAQSAEFFITLNFLKYPYGPLAD